MSGFSLEWLRQREPFDLAARNRDCVASFASALGRCAARPLRVLDLAAGSGASFRALAPLIGIDQHWTLTDSDAGLLAAQSVEIAHWAAAAGWSNQARPGAVSGSQVHAGEACWIAQGRVIDLARQLDAIDFTTFDAVTTSAFLDLVSGAWLDRLARLLAEAKLPLLAMLNVDGKRLWHPALPDDAAVLAAFARHQTGDKGFGPALGLAAAPYLAQVLRNAGYEVNLARSDWHIGPDARTMLDPLLDDTVRAACEAHPDQASRFARWGAARRSQLNEGALALEVGHLDLLALPPLRSALHT